jgi:hypothetical protein
VTTYGDSGFGMHALVLRKLSSGKYERIGVAEWGEDIRGISNASDGYFCSCLECKLNET